MSLEREDLPPLSGALNVAAQNNTSGRLLTHGLLGTNQTFMFNHFPFLTQRPGLLSYSRGYHDSLSVFPIEYMEFTDLDFDLYNIKLLISRGNLPESLKAIFPYVRAVVNDSLSFHVYELKPTYGYFTPVRTVGFLYGDFKLARAAIVKHIIPLYMSKLVFEHSISSPPLQFLQKRSPLERKIGIETPPATRRQVVESWLVNNGFLSAESKQPLVESFFPLISHDQPSESDVNVWDFIHVTAPETEEALPSLLSVLQGVVYPKHHISVFLKTLINFYRNQSIPTTPAKSGIKIIQEWVTHTPTVYSAEVVVSPSAVKPFHSVFPSDHERLLLKVTYHPYWECYYHTFTDPHKKLTRRENSQLQWTPATVHHVTPNMMAIDLPVGHHEVIFKYRNPDYQKFSGVICLIVLFVLVIVQLSKWVVCLFV